LRGPSTQHAFRPFLRAFLVALAVVLGRAPSASAQVIPPPSGFALSSWSTADGLPQSAITDLALDPEGYLWVGTLAGLARFDGDSFVSHPRGAGAPEVTGVKSLVTDREGRVWVAWTDGIARIDPAGRLQRAGKVPVVWPQLLAVGAPDSVWMGFYADVWLYADRAWRQLPAVPFGIAGEIQAVFVDSRGALWIGGTSGLARYDPASGRPAHRVTAAGQGRVTSIVPAGSGDVWVSVDGDVVRVAADESAQRLELDAPGSLPVTRLAVQDDGVLWIAGAWGVRRLHLTGSARGPWRARTTFAHPLDLAGSVPTAMRPGANGSVWVGTSGAGLRLLRPLPVGRVTLANGLVDREAHSLAPDGTGGMWIGGACGGLVRWRDGKSEVFEAPALGMQTSCVRGLLRDRAGSLWIGQLAWLTRVSAAGHVDTMVRMAPYDYADIFPLLEDRMGRVWYGSSTGTLGSFGPDASHTRVADGVLARERIWSLVEDSVGVWAGQVGEVTHLVDGRAVERLGAAEGMPPGPIRALAFDRDGGLWIASYGGGLARHRPGHRVEPLVPGGRAFEQKLSAINIDGADRFWFLGDAGVSMIPHAELDNAIDSGRAARGVLELGLADGVPEGNNGTPNTVLDRETGRLWAATVDGVVSVDLSRFPQDSLAARLLIDDVRLDGASGASSDSVIVPVGVNAVEIRFTAPSFGGPGDLRFRYRLRGHDRDWVESGSARVARYANLPPGHYTFELTSRSRDGFERTTPLALPVIVRPHWWQTLAARIIFVLAAMFALWSSFQWFTRRLRERARVLQHEITVREQAEAQAAAAARDLAHVSRLATAGELATSIAHELNQPLTAVVGSAQTARRLLNGQGQEPLRELLDAIVTQSDRAADVIRSLRAFVLKQRATDELLSVDVVVSDTLRLMQPELAVRSVAVRVVNEQATPAQVRCDPIQLQQVLVNLLLNAAEAMSSLPPAERRITLLMRSDGEDAVRVSVFDAGPGLAPEALARVFEPFFTTKPNGLGLGLSLSHSIIEAHSGRLWAESSPGKGSAFHIHLPVSES